MSEIHDDRVPTPSPWASPLLAHVALVALVLFSIGQALSMFAPLVKASARAQIVFLINPSTGGSIQQLQTYLDDGWRIIHVTSGIAANASPVAGGSRENWYSHTVFVLER